jgi:hypothetical protein
MDVIGRLSDLLPPRPVSPANRGWGMDQYRQTGRHAWGNHTFDSVERDCATFQPTDAMRRLRERLEEDLPVFTTRTRPRRLNNQKVGDRVGNRVEYERYSAGASTEPRFWSRRERQERRHTGTVTMLVNIGLSGGEHHANLEWSGACALAMTDALENMGYRVHLYAVLDSQGHPIGTYHAAFEVKGPDERLSEASMAVVSDGGIRRILWWSWLSARSERVERGYGIPTDYTGPLAATADVIIPKSITSADQAFEFVKAQVDALRKRGEEV